MMTVSSTNFNTVQDFEVFGVGARRRFDLQNSSEPIELIRHPWTFLPGIEEETLSWLKPAKVTQASMPLVADLLLHKFDQIFLKGAALLGDLKPKILADYLREMPWQEGLLDDHFRYFAMFLKRRFPQNPNWSEVFQCEWVRSSRLYESHGELSDASGAQFELSPSFQIYSLAEQASTALAMEPGLYACSYDNEKQRLSEIKLNPVEARLIDWIENDSGFSRERVQSMMMDEGFSQQKIQSAIERLQQAQIIR